MKIFKYIALFVCGFLWLEGCSVGLSKWLAERNLVKDDYRYGDLYRISNLAQFKELKQECKPEAVKKIQNTHLVLAGDSFTEDGRIDEDQLAAAKVTKIRVDGVSKVSLNPNEKNILIIETVERHFRERFGHIWQAVVFEEKPQTESFKQKIKRLFAVDMPYNKELHESVLFGYDWTMKIREWKAQLNYTLFNRVDEGVALSKDQKHVLYYLPSQSGISSAFDAIPDDEINALVANVNETYAFYKAHGFDEVYLSIIPNKTSILGRDLGEYNQLVNRIQDNPRLKMNLIDVNTPFEKMGEAAYALGDTHWSCAGQQVWLDQANALFKADSLQVQ